MGDRHANFGAGRKWILGSHVAAVEAQVTGAGIDAGFMLSFEKLDSSEEGVPRFTSMLILRCHRWTLSTPWEARVNLFPASQCSQGSSILFCRCRIALMLCYQESCVSTGAE